MRFSFKYGCGETEEKGFYLWGEPRDMDGRTSPDESFSFSDISGTQNKVHLFCILSDIPDIQYTIYLLNAHIN